MEEDIRTHASRQQKILEAIREARRPLSPKEIEERTDLSHGNVRNGVREMLEAGLLYQPQYGQYDIPKGERVSGFISRLRELVSDPGEVARRAGIDESEVRRAIEGGEEPSVTVAVAIADALKVDVLWLVTGKKEPRPEDQGGAAHEPEVDFIMPENLGMGSVQSRQVPEHAIVKFIGLTVGGKLQVALDLVISGRRERVNMPVDVGDIKIQRET